MQTINIWFTGNTLMWYCQSPTLYSWDTTQVLAWRGVFISDSKYASFAHQSEHISTRSSSPVTTPFFLQNRVLVSFIARWPFPVTKRCPMDDRICCSKACKYTKTLPSRQQCWWSVGLGAAKTKCPWFIKTWSSKTVKESLQLCSGTPYIGLFPGTLGAFLSA